MRIIFSLGLAVLASQAAWTQGEFVNRARRTRPDFEFLYDRLSASDFVVRGKLLDMKAVIKRLSLFSVDELRRMRNMEWMGGSLFTIEPQEILCRQSDLVPSSLAAEPPAGRLYIFVPWRVPERDPGRVFEYDRNRLFVNEFPAVALGREYLLLLRKTPHQEDLTSKNELDPVVTYYRTVEGDLGAVELPDATDRGRRQDFVTPLVSAITALCEAVKAPDVETKIRNLQAVRDHSADPAWRQSVDAAISALQKAAVKLPEQ
jgi:hypothetical protein